MNEPIPLSHEPSAGDTHKLEATTLPSEVVRCLENAQFLHLATCRHDRPQVSLMAYTYLAASPFSPAAPVIVMTTNPSSRKADNLLENPHVSLLVHDWVSHRPPTIGDGSSPPAAARSGLAAVLFGLNTSARSSISATINGTARLAVPGSDEERFYLHSHLENNTFRPGSGPGPDATSATAADDGDGARVIIVHLDQVRISDWKGTVRDYDLVSDPRNGA